VREPVPGDPLGVAGARVVGLHHPPDAAHVVVSEERRQLVDVGVGVGVPVVAGEERRQARGIGAAGREVAGRVLEREVEHRLHPVARGEVRREALGGVEDLAEHEELALALALGVGQNLRAERLPELVVDVLHRVDAEPVDAEVADPGLVDVDHAAHDPGILGEQVVEAEEVAVVGVLADERRVAAVVVERDVVEPRRHLEVLLGRVERRHVRERRRGVECREVVGAGVVAVVELVAGCRRVGPGVLADVALTGAALVADHVGGVVGDDVEVDLHAPAVCGLDQRAQVLVGAQVRVDLREVGDPVAVVAGGRPVLELHRLVLEARRQPDRRGAQTADVVDLREQALEVAAVVEPGPGRVEAGHQRIVAQATGVVGGVAVGEAVGHDEVEVFVGHRRAQRVATVETAVAVVGGGRPRRQNGGEEHGEQEGEHPTDGHADPL
jgi:hypothetical protein